MDVGTTPLQPGSQLKSIMNSVLSINVCLGLQNKITIARTWIKIYCPTILFISEAEITNNMDLDWLQIQGYDLVTTNSKPKARLVAYVKTDLKCKIFTKENIEAITVSTKTFKWQVYIVLVNNQREYLTDLIDFIKITWTQPKGPTWWEMWTLITRKLMTQLTTEALWWLANVNRWNQATKS